MEEDKVKEGTLRILTSGEIALARSIFGSSIAYHRVWVHCDSYLPLGLQGKNVAMAPNGEMYFRKEKFRHDFSTGALSDKHFFMHEMVHVWQHQRGVWVRTRGAFSWAAKYSYTLDGKKKFDNYNMEQQAQIIADYFILDKFGWDIWQKQIKKSVSFEGKADRNILSFYKIALPPSLL